LGRTDGEPIRAFHYARALLGGKSHEQEDHEAEAALPAQQGEPRQAAELGPTLERLFRRNNENDPRPKPGVVAVVLVDRDHPVNAGLTASGCAAGAAAVTSAGKTSTGTLLKSLVICTVTPTLLSGIVTPGGTFSNSPDCG
jgi:hypothetical protein